MKTKSKLLHYGLSLLTASAALLSVTPSVQAADKKPNILFIFPDDVGWQNVSAYQEVLGEHIKSLMENSPAQKATTFDFSELMKSLMSGKQ